MLRFGIILTLITVYCHTAIGHGDVHTRIDIVSEEIADDPGNPMLYVKRANLYLEDGDFKNTGADLKKAQKLGGKEYSPTMLGYANMYFKLGSDEVAVKYINSFLELTPLHVIGLQTKAKILEKMDDIEGAVLYYRLVIENTSTPLPENYFRLINALQKIERKDEAIFYCDEAMRELGTLLVFEQKIIDLHMESHNYHAAIQKLDNILGQQERKEKWYYQKALIYQQMGESDNTLKQLDLAMKSIRALPQRIQTTPAMKTLTTSIKDQRNKAKPLSDDPKITGEVYTE